MSSVLGRIGKTGGATAQSFGGVTPYSWIGRSEALAGVGNDMWASRTVARASAIAGAMSANIGSDSDGKPAHRAGSEYAVMHA